MFKRFFKSKIHRCTVTEANPDYEGSITVDPLLLEAAGIRPFEMVFVWDVTNGQRIETYAIKGEEGSGQICINGGAAHLIKKGDLVIIATECFLNPDENPYHEPICVFVDENNKIKDVKIHYTSTH